MTDEPRAEIPVIFDTDIGTNIDDALALALILASPELELLGVTTASGDTAARARLAAKLLHYAGRPDVPVAAGEAGRALPIEQCHWADGFSSSMITKQPAVDFLAERIERRPEEIILLAVGPLTNVARLVSRYPATAKKLKQLVMMGGSINRGYEPGSPPAAEVNIARDVGAAQAVFSTGLPILMVPLDVTAMIELDPAGRRRLFGRHTPLTNALALLYHLWNQPTPILYDPVAVAMTLDPTWCETKPLAIEVDSGGFTRFVEGKPPNAVVALRINSERFVEFFLGRVAPV
jgi:inosine-uridine nucleoside N-ribohydrolase